jgi:asparagine synthase (glutamine-hydrolysing)
MHRAGPRDQASVLWPILNFALWHRHWIEGAEVDDLALQATARQ